MVETEKELEAMYEGFLQTNPRKAAEVAYVLAKRALDAGQNERVKHYGREALRLFDKFPMLTIEECAAHFTVLGGVALPSLIHQDVVKSRLRPLEL